MSRQQTPLTYEAVLEMFRQTDQRFQETDRLMQETDRRMRETDRKISALGSRIGEIVENMIGGDIVQQFQALGYDISSYYRNRIFGNRGTNESGEIDLILEDGDIAILIEAKTSLQTADVKEHIERLEKYRRHLEKHGDKTGRRFIGAVAGAVVDPEVVKFAHKNGLYVIVQSGKAIEIIPSPNGFVAKKW